MPCKPSLRGGGIFIAKDVLGDGRCGYRCLAMYLGMSVGRVMRIVLDLMVASKNFSAQQVLGLCIACDLQNACPKDAWLSDVHLRLLVEAAPALFPTGVLVNQPESQALKTWVWFQAVEPLVLLSDFEVLELFIAGARPCLLGHVRSPEQHFFSLDAPQWIHRTACAAEDAQLGANCDTSSKAGAGAATSPMHAAGGRSVRAACQNGMQQHSRAEIKASYPRLQGGADVSAGPPFASGPTCVSLPSSVWRAILRYTAGFYNTATLCRVSRETRDLIVQPRFWRGIRMLVPDSCGCMHMCLCRCIRALWPSQSVQRLRRLGPSEGSMLMLPEGPMCSYSRRQVTSRRFVHAWLAASSGPPLSSIRLCASQLFASESLGRLYVGYTRQREAEKVAEAVYDFGHPDPDAPWYFRFSCRQGSLSSCPTARVARGDLPVTHRCSDGTDVTGPNIVCLSFSARELACSWNGRLASRCRLPLFVTFPAHDTSLRWFCMLDTNSTLPEEADSPSTAVLPVATVLQSQNALPICDIQFHGGSVRTLPKRPPWADMEDEEGQHLANQPAIRTPVSRGVQDQNQHGALSCEAVQVRPVWAEQLVRSQKRSVSFLRACAQLLDKDMEALGHDIADVAKHNYGWANFFRNDDFSEHPMPLYLMHMLLSNVLRAEIQVAYIPSGRCLLLGNHGVEHIEVFSSSVPTVAISEHSGRAFAVRKRERWGEAATRGGDGVAIEALMFGPAKDLLRPAEDIFFCLGTTRLDCVTVLRAFERVHGLQVDSTFEGQTLSVAGASQLCLSVLPMLPTGIIVLNARGTSWHVTWDRHVQVACGHALHLIAQGARCVAWCAFAQRWRCALLRRPCNASWLGTVCAGVGSATLQKVFVQTEAGTVGEDTQQGLVEDLAGGASHRNSSTMEFLAPQLGQRVMILKDQWLKLILSGRKTMELRSKRAKTGWTWLGKGNFIHARGRIAACQELTADTFQMYRAQHGLETDAPPYTRTFALWLEDVQPLDEPAAFFKPWGPIGWAIVRFKKTDLPSRARPGRGKQVPAQRQPRTETGLPNIGNTCFVNAVLQALLHLPDIKSLLQRCAAMRCEQGCLWCLLRRTMRARDNGRANRACMEGWLPWVREFGLDVGRQDSAVLFATAVCDVLQEQQQARLCSSLVFRNLQGMQSKFWAVGWGGGG